MNSGNNNRMTVKSRQALDSARCPECGEQMKEVERCNEGGILFIWYECEKENCDGQWLQKMAQ